jgi:Mce-associated membrane protein
MRRWGERLLGLAAVVLAGAFVGLAAAGGWLYWDRVERRAAEMTRAALAPLAADEMPKVLGYEYKTVERSLTEVYPLMTPDYRQQFQDRAKNDIIPQARDRRVVNQISVVGVGVLEAQRISGSVLVYMNRTVTDKSNKEPLYDGSRVRVDYRKIDGKWLIDDIRPV